MPRSFRIDPDAKKDFVFDWSGWLAGDTIADHTLTKTGSVEIAAGSRTSTAVTVWVDDVGDGATGSVTCHIVTAAGREDDRTMTFYGRHE